MRRHREATFSEVRARLAPFACCTMAVFAVACRDTVTAPSRTPPAAYANVNSAKNARQRADSAAVDTLTHAIALALADPSLRERLIQDLRESPWRKHALDLATYLGRASGNPIAAAAAGKSSIASNRLISIASRLGLQIQVPRAIDRSTWRGTDDIVVIGLSEAPAALAPAGLPASGYTLSGTAISVPIWHYTSYPVLAILPAEFSFGQNPEATRRAATTRSQRTISTFDEEITAMTVRHAQAGGSEPQLPALRGSVTPQICTCDDCPEMDYCDPPPPAVVGITLPSGRTFAQCQTIAFASFNNLNADNDGLLDSCEEELAVQFQPRVAFSSTDDNANRESYYAVKIANASTQTVSIFYPIGYYFDMGSPNPACNGCGAHVGDSEFIILEVSHLGSGRWGLSYATLSAHWGAPLGDGTARYAYSALEFPINSRGRPRVWVAENKHANYRSRSVCDAGAYYTDTCDRNSDYTTWGNELQQVATVVVPGVPTTWPDNKTPLRNIGNSGLTFYLDGLRYNYMLDAVTSYYFKPGTEEFWSGEEFCGWQAATGDCSTAYATSLLAFGF